MLAEQFLCRYRESDQPEGPDFTRMMAPLPMERSLNEPGRAALGCRAARGRPQGAGASFRRSCTGPYQAWLCEWVLSVSDMMATPIRAPGGSPKQRW